MQQAGKGSCCLQYARILPVACSHVCFYQNVYDWSDELKREPQLYLIIDAMISFIQPVSSLQRPGFTTVRNKKYFLWKII